VPLHFTAFHPDYKMDDLSPTPAATLTRARGIAIAEGLRYVYTGNVHDETGGTTRCAGCQAPLIVRDWHHIESYRVTPQGTCPDCATVLPGRYAAQHDRFGRRRIPVVLSRATAVPPAS
jgi:pyruvate formate lyase activating enzyme